MKPKCKKRLIGIASILLLVAGHSLAEASHCQALVSVKNDLWLVNEDGSASHRLTTDGKQKLAAAISSTGSLVAYNTNTTSNGPITIIDTQGRFVAEINPFTRDAITGLTWIYPDILRAQEHRSPYSSIFHFLKIQGGSVSSMLMPSANGSSCALSPSDKKMACIQGDTISTNNKVIYYASNPFSSVVDIQTLSVPSGSIVTTSTSPSFSIEAKKVSEQIVSLKVTTSDGSSREEMVRVGDTMPLLHAEGGGAAAVYGFYPSLATLKEAIAVRVVRSKIGKISFEGGIAWDNIGQRLAVVETNELGRKFLILLNADSAAIAKENVVLFRKELPLAGSIQSIQFTSENKLRVTGSYKIFEQGLSTDKRALSGGYTLIPALPERLAVSVNSTSLLADVYGWSCH